MKQDDAPAIATVPIMCSGQLQESRAERWGDVYNPSTGRVIARVPLCDRGETSEVIETAAAAFDDWQSTPIVERARQMFGYRDLLESHFEQLAALVTREHGKTLAESRGEVRRAIEMVEFACGIPSLSMGQALPNIARGLDAGVSRHPLGVCVGVTPFNFPLMVPAWMFPVALVCGNTFVLKPSEKVPLSVVRAGELLTQAGFPPGVFNIVHGDRECVETLLTHPSVSAVSFVGSTDVARHIYQTASHAGKRVQAAGGAKNHLVVMPDADLDATVEAIVSSAFGCAGQRCMAGSVVVAVGDAANELLDRLVDRASQLRVAVTDGVEEVDMGPVIRRAAVERVAAYVDVGRKEGGHVVLDGRGKHQGEGFFLGPCIVDRVQQDARLAREEVFGPLLSVIRAADLDAAIALGDRSEYGNGASIFTRDGRAARHFRQRFNAGMIGVNVGVPAPQAWLPFTGRNASFYGDLHMQGAAGIQFFTRPKVTLTQWPA